MIQRWIVTHSYRVGREVWDEGDRHCPPVCPSSIMEPHSHLPMFDGSPTMERPKSFVRFGVGVCGGEVVRLRHDDFRKTKRRREPNRRGGVYGRRPLYLCSLVKFLKNTRFSSSGGPTS